MTGTLPKNGSPVPQPNIDYQLGVGYLGSDVKLGSRS